MTPACTKQNTALYVPKEPLKRAEFWRIYKLALEDAKTHSITELESMAKMEHGHAQRDAILHSTSFRRADARN